MAQLYDTIGIGYEYYRRPDRRIATAILDALGDAATVVNVGAGAGSYEPADRSVVAVEPSLAMIRQRPAVSGPVVQASAMHLPFRDGAFVAALAVLTVHHWADRRRGLAELARVAQHRVVILTWDPATSGFWLVEDYFPAIAEIDRQILPPMEELRQALGPIEIRPLPGYPTIAPMASLGRTGGGRMRIWTLASAAPSPHSLRSATSNPAFDASVVISPMASGNVAMAISYASPSLIWVTDWSLRSLSVGEQLNALTTSGSPAAIAGPAMVSRA
jgi:SAM-dependent methyltransferase